MQGGLTGLVRRATLHHPRHNCLFCGVTMRWRSRDAEWHSLSWRLTVSQGGVKPEAWWLGVVHTYGHLQLSLAKKRE